MNTNTLNPSVSWNSLSATVWTASQLVAITIGGLLNRAARFLNEPSQTDRRASEPAPPPASGGPLAVLVIDASPSMEATDWKPSRLLAAKDAATAYVRRLNIESPDARAAVVAYHAAARTVCKPTPVAQYDYLARRIESIGTKSATNITAGLQQALTNLNGHHGACQVVLLTDGAHNYGTGPQSIAGKLRRRAVLETVGIGGTPADVDEKLLKAIASAYADGRKRYRWIGDRDGLVTHFETLAGRLARS